MLMLRCCVLPLRRRRYAIDDRYARDGCARTAAAVLVVDVALEAQELADASEAADRFIDSVFHGAHPLPPGFEKMVEEHEKDGGHFSGHLALACFYDRALEKLLMHPRLWPIVLELTGGKPQLSGGGTRVGTMIVDDHAMTVVGDPLDIAHRSRMREGGAGWHSNRDGGGNSRYGLREDGTIYANNFVVFVYLDDVHQGDGGLLVIPGSHKSSFNNKSSLPGHDPQDQEFLLTLDEDYEGKPYAAVRDKAIHWNGHPDPAPRGSVNVCPKAGSFVVMTENTTHGTMPVRLYDIMSLQHHLNVGMSTRSICGGDVMF
eukprot:COSAG01_NODE_245_length_20483_cov_32.975314_23_plen_316_part_00